MCIYLYYPHCGSKLWIYIYIDVYYKYKFKRPHGPRDMTHYTNKHYTMT